MRRQLEGSLAVAQAVALCRPEVVSAYPISPQTHIVEALSDLVRAGDLAPCEYLMVESEFGALSAAIGASAMGARAYTATASQGLLYMAEALYNASGLGLPIVMTVANRAIGAPINIWNDHSDSMSQRDCGWIQLYAESNQEAVDLHLQAFRLAEEVSLPVMVCMDGFVLTHAIEAVELPTQEQVDAFLPPFRPRQVLDPDDPVTIGAMVGPEAFTEVKYLMHAKQMQALDVLPEIAGAFSQAFGRTSGGLVRPYRSADAETVVVALGSVLGTIEEVVDELREQGVRIGALGISCFRPYPTEEVRAALQGARRVVVLEKAFAVGLGGIVGQNVRLALSGLPVTVYDAVAGLGGRPITRATLRTLFADVLEDRLEPNRLAFVDLNRDLVERELQRVAATRRSGPHAENVLRDLGTVASSAHGGAPS
jgi:pyruvate ferredoxin oxidoreductase alpha subunit